MSTYSESFAKLMASEGGYVNDPQDPGGETYKGISRRAHPDWDGWAIIDARKTQCPDLFPTVLDIDTRLHSMVLTFYKQHYWLELGCDKFKPNIAHRLFDFGVNCGVRTASKAIQEILITFGADIVADGDIGKKTIYAYYENKKTESVLLGFLIGKQLSYYDKIINKNQTLGKFAGGWVKRVLDA